MPLDHLDHAADAVLDALLSSTSHDILPDDLLALMDQAGMTAQEATPADADLDDLLATIPAAAPSFPDVPQSPPSTPQARVYRRLGDTIAFLRSQGHHNLARQVLVAYSCKAHGGDPLRYQREDVAERQEREVAETVAYPPLPSPPTIQHTAIHATPPNVNITMPESPPIPVPVITVNVPEQRVPQVNVTVPRAVVKTRTVHRDEKGLITRITETEDEVAV